MYTQENEYGVCAPLRVYVVSRNGLAVIAFSSREKAEEKVKSLNALERVKYSWHGIEVLDIDDADMVTYQDIE